MYEYSLHSVIHSADSVYQLERIMSKSILNCVLLLYLISVYDHSNAKTYPIVLTNFNVQKLLGEY